MPDLHGHERQEEQIERAQHDSRLDDAQGGRYRPHLRAQCQFLPKKQTSQVSSHAYREERNYRHMREVNMKKPVDEVLKDCIRCYQKRAENQHRHKGEHRPPEYRGGGAGSTS